MEKSWVHASEGYDVELACVIHGDITSDVSSLKLANRWINGYILKSIDDVVPKLVSAGPIRPEVNGFKI